MAVRLLLLLLDSRVKVAAFSASMQSESVFLCFGASLLPHQFFRLNTV
jgi:hypothetical protein